MYSLLFYCFFFFKQKTAYEMRISDCSSDVCSSDLEERIGVMRPEFGLPRKLAGETVGTEHDVRDLPRQAGDIEARAVDDLDPLDIGGRNAGQLGDDRVRLGRWPRAVEQDRKSVV